MLPVDFPELSATWTLNLQSGNLAISSGIFAFRVPLISSPTSSLLSELNMSTWNNQDLVLFYLCVLSWCCLVVLSCSRLHLICTRLYFITFNLDFIWILVQCSIFPILIWQKWTKYWTKVLSLGCQHTLLCFNEMKWTFISLK